MRSSIGVDSIRRDSLECFSPHSSPHFQNQRTRSASSWVDNLRQQRPEQLKADLHRLFIMADSNGDGALQIDELQTLLEHAGVGLSDMQVQVLFTKYDSNHSGTLGLVPFLNLMHEVIQGGLEDDAAPIVDLSQLSSPELNEYLGELFEMGDINGDGVLSPMEFARILRAAKLDLSASEVLAVMKEADKDCDGQIDYTEFAPCVQGLVEQRRAVHGRGLRESGDAHWRDMSEEELQAELLVIFQQADQNHDGWLQGQTFLAALESVQLGLHDELILQLYLSTPQSEDGKIDFAAFLGKL
eukprot:TRINITY_DN6660_c0_g1_i1.p1 TRINITY_DN6660_c0_g1~~TRINITY_DN6660_c0_g1_i1.p1  ORF type:complete len:299 (+),score=51.84 TRINITY_DN6660_c0_g1_i1:282-1178(+)